jgi:hypothetical protein
MSNDHPLCSRYIGSQGCVDVPSSSSSFCSCLDSVEFPLFSVFCVGGGDPWRRLYTSRLGILDGYPSMSATKERRHLERAEQFCCPGPRGVGVWKTKTASRAPGHPLSTRIISGKTNLQTCRLLIRPWDEQLLLITYYLLEGRWSSLLFIHEEALSVCQEGWLWEIVLHYRSFVVDNRIITRSRPLATSHSLGMPWLYLVVSVLSLVT